MARFNPQDIPLPEFPESAGLRNAEILYVLRNRAENGYIEHWHDFRICERDDNTILGAINLFLVGDEFWINKIWISEAFRRRGIGSYLIRVAKGLSKFRDYGKIYARLQPFDGVSKQDLRRFYAYHGFIQDTSKDWGDHEVFSATP